jgi:hypothetical protein
MQRYGRLAMRFLKRAEDPKRLAADLERWWAGELNSRGPRFLRRYLDRRLFRRLSRADQPEVDRLLDGGPAASVTMLRQPYLADRKQPRRAA